MSKTAIVLGATGLVGAEVVKHLDSLEAITKIIAITRRPVEYSSSKIENQVIEFERLSDYADVFNGDMMFSCLGTTVKQAGSIAAQRVVDLDYQYQAAKLSAENGVNHYLLVSSSGAKASSANAYMKMKGQLEQRVSQLSFRSISIFQPSLLLGQREQARFAEELGSKILPTLCKLPGLRRFRPIRGSQVAEKMVEVSSNPKAGVTKFALDQVFPG